MKFPRIKLTERLSHSLGSMMPRVHPFAVFTACTFYYTAISRGLAYDAAIFHTIILHIVGLLNHSRQGGHGIPIPSSCGTHCNRSR